MQVNSPASSRAAWYDRNPKTIYYWDAEDAIAPHATVNRWTYTVPSGRKARAELTFLWIYRDTAASSVGIASIFIKYAPKTTNDATIVQLDFDNNTVNAILDNSQNLQLMMQETDQIYEEDKDSGTGGTVSFLDVFKGTEFDA